MIRLICIALVTSMMFSCGGSDNGTTIGNNGVSPPAFTGTPNSAQDTRAIAGLYDARTIFSDEVDIAYFAIDNNGSGYLLKFEGDCYSTAVLVVANQGNDSYLVGAVGESGIVMSLIASNEQLSLTRELQNFTIPRVGGLNPPYRAACDEDLPLDVLGIGAPSIFPDAVPGVEPPAWITGSSSSGTSASPIANNPQPTGTTDTSRVAGLWDSSSMESGVLDTKYILISDSGVIKEYDYLGDDAGQGSNCYSLTEGIIRHLGGDRYYIELHSETGEVTITVSNNTLNLTDVASGASFTFLAASNFDNSIPTC